VITRLPSVVVVGAGGIASAYGHLLRESTIARAGGVVDIRSEAAERLASDLSCSWALSLDELVARGDQPDVVVVATPPSSHPGIIRDAVRLGSAVFCEKPVAASYAHAVESVATVASAGLPFAMATKFRFSDDVVAAKRLTDDGAIGEVHTVHIGFSSRLDLRGRWQADPAVAGGGVIVDNGTHALDLAMYLVGDLSRVRAVEGHRPAGLDVEDTVDLFCDSVSGVHVHVDLSWSIESGRSHFCRLVGSSGEIQVGFASSAWRTFGQEWNAIGDGYRKFPAMGGALDAFLHWVDSGVVDARLNDGLRTAALVDAALDSLNRGVGVSL
jgi:predicted dehydrogenase